MEKSTEILKTIQMTTRIFTEDDDEFGRLLDSLDDDGRTEVNNRNSFCLPIDKFDHHKP